VIYGDLHIHIGRTAQGKHVKITASPKLNLEHIPNTAKQKGLGIVGIVDAACSGVLEDLKTRARAGDLRLLAGGGYMWEGLHLFLGHEVELVHTTGREAHFLAFFPDLEQLEGYAENLSSWVTNSSLSTQRLRASPDSWLQNVAEHKGVALAAHAFTPHKGVYGNCIRTLGEMFSQPDLIHGLELGLSCDTDMALQVKDTHGYAYIANSDAHSLGTIGREFTAFDLPLVNFQEWKRALEQGGQGIVATHGLDPLLGKYFRSFCQACDFLARGEEALSECPLCGKAMVMGVWDRLRAISDFQGQAMRKPPYQAHVPLMMLPGVGPRIYSELIHGLGTEIEILYTVSLVAISDLVGGTIARQIQAFRSGQLVILPGEEENTAVSRRPNRP
jgi:uncharacterized protein (TIGR00375 family)